MPILSGTCRETPTITRLPAADSCRLQGGSELGEVYTDALKANADIIAGCVTENLYDGISVFSSDSDIPDTGLIRIQN